RRRHTRSKRHWSSDVCSSDLEVDLQFQNGERRTYERLRTPPIPAVMLVPMLDDDTVVLIREYGVGKEEYQLTLPKGALDPGEDWRTAGKRELKKEAVTAAKKRTQEIPMSVSQG